MIVLSDTDIQKLIPESEYVEAIEESYRLFGLGKISVMPRITHWFSQEFSKSLKISTSASSDAGYFGVIMYSSGFGKAQPRRLIVLFDFRTGKCISVMHAENFAWLRTGATSAVGAKYLARKDSSIVGIIGTGKQARSQLIMLSHIFKINEIRVYSPNQLHREKFSNETGDRFKIKTYSVSNAKAAVKDADIVVLATTSKKPVILREWLSEGAHVNAMGAHQPHAREFGDDLLENTKFVVDFYEQAMNEYGEVIIPVQGGKNSGDIIYAELGEIICGEKPGRESQNEITIFKSGGTGIDFLLLAVRTYIKAVKTGLGVKTII